MRVYGWFCQHGKPIKVLRHEVKNLQERGQCLAWVAQYTIALISKCGQLRMNTCGATMGGI